MNRWEQMQNFLIHLAKLTKADPQTMLQNDRQVYHELVRNGLTDSQKQFYVGDYFDQWINEFKNKKNINVFVAPNWQYFCQFTTGDLLEDRTHIKMYVPLRPENIYYGANILFDFLAKNNIAHRSKIGKWSRVDGVVVRVGSKEDAMKVAQFVESNEYLKNGLYNANLFLLNDGNIAYATDANYSFNSEIASYLHEYMYKCYYEGTLDNVNIRDFFLHVRDSYQKVFYEKDGQAINSYMASREMAYDRDRFANLANKSKIVELLLMSMSPDGKLEHVMQTYSQLMDPSYMANIENQFKEKEKEHLKQINQTERIVDENELISQKLADVICADFKKYGYSHTYGALSRLVLLDKNDAFKEMSEALNGISSIKIQEIINRECGSLNYDVYLKRILSSRGENIPSDQSLDFEKLKSAITSNYLTHKYLNTKDALAEYIKTGSTARFTRNDGARFIMQSLNPQKVKNIIVAECGELNVDLYLNKYLKALEIKCTAFEAASIATLRKYNRESLETAIKNAKNGDFLGFTRCGELNLRGNLMKNVTPGEIEMVMKATLIRYGIDNENDLTEELLNALESIVGSKTNNPETFGQR